MARELADITIKLKEIEETDYDAVIEFLDDEHIKYEQVDVENRLTDYSEEELEPDYYDEWRDRKLMEEENE